MRSSFARLSRYVKFDDGVSCLFLFCALLNTIERHAAIWAHGLAVHLHNQYALKSCQRSTHDSLFAGTVLLTREHSTKTTQRASTLVKLLNTRDRRFLSQFGAHTGRRAGGQPSNALALDNKTCGERVGGLVTQIHRCPRIVEARGAVTGLSV